LLNQIRKNETNSTGKMNVNLGLIEM